MRSAHPKAMWSSPTRYSLKPSTGAGEEVMGATAAAVAFYAATRP